MKLAINVAADSIRKCSCDGNNRGCSGQKSADNPKRLILLSKISTPVGYAMCFVDDHGDTVFPIFPFNELCEFTGTLGTC